MKQYPAIHLALRQGNPEQVCEMLDAGDVDMAIVSVTARALPTLAAIPCCKVIKERGMRAE